MEKRTVRKGDVMVEEGMLLTFDEFEHVTCRLSLLEIALEEYGKHKRDCLVLLWNTMHPLQKSTLVYECTCGFDEIKG